MAKQNLLRQKSSRRPRIRWIITMKMLHHQFQWSFTNFRCGRTIKIDPERSGRPSEVATPQIITG